MAEQKFTEAELRARLTTEQFHVTQDKGTERAFTGKYHDSKADGIYKCIVCAEPLFDSEAKFDSGTGWPSFYQPKSGDVVGEEEDRSHFMVRTEVHCRKCGAHLGHLFDDARGTPTGMRYCINSASLELEQRD